MNCPGGLQHSNMPLTLAYSTVGIDTAPPLVILHGLFGSGRNWAGIGRRLAEATGRRVWLPDQRNHGASPWANTMDYAALADDLSGFLDQHRLNEDVVLLGHSMGGKAAMWLALSQPPLSQPPLSQPQRVVRLVVVDIAPVTYHHTHAALVATLQGLDLTALHRRAEADQALAAALPDAALRAFLLQNLVSTEEGRGLRWRLNLPVLAACMPALFAFPAPPEWSATLPALFLAAGQAHYLRPEHHARITARFPAAQIQTVADAGHWLHAERPEAVVQAVAAFLKPPGA